MKVWVFLFLLIVSNSLFADVSIRLKGGKNYGEFLEQVGGGYSLVYEVSDSGKIPPIVLGGGSRISYPNQFSYLGIGVLFQWKAWRWESEFDSTLGYAYTGIGKNEDFYWKESSRNLVPGFDTSRWRFRDSGYSFEHADLFNISIEKVSVLDHRWQNRFERDFFSYENVHLYGILGLSFYKNFFITYDINNYALDDRVLGYTALGGSFENKIVELQGGIGIRSTYFSERLVIDTSFAPLIGLNRSTDFHLTRNIYFHHSGFGNGFLARLESKFFLNSEFAFGLRYSAHRFYSVGAWRMSGIPNNYEDLVTTSIDRGAGRNWVTNKESRWEAYLEYKIR